MKIDFINETEHKCTYTTVQMTKQLSTAMSIKMINMKKIIMQIHLDFNLHSKGKTYKQ